MKFCCTVDSGYKNIVASRKTCSYNRYVLIKGKINRWTDRNVSSEDVLITGMFLYPVVSSVYYMQNDISCKFVALNLLRKLEKFCNLIQYNTFHSKEISLINRLAAAKVS